MVGRSPFSHNIRFSGSALVSTAFPMARYATVLY
jgi:hypothetical protein